jgi:hypothetical protein
MLLNRQLLNILTQLLHLKVETCGVLKLVNGKVVLEIHTSQTDKNNECLHNYYAEHIFHTHVLSNKSYPSAPDIVKVLKNSKIVTSLIICHWGIWEICSLKKQLFTPSEQEYIVHTISKMLYPIREYKNFDGNVARYIQDIEDKYKVFGLRIKFTSWSDIGKVVLD